MLIDWGFVGLMLIVAPVGITICCFVDACRVPDESLYRRGTRSLWLTAIFLFGFFGAVSYLLWGQPRGKKQ
jgi:hypothetical protein